MNGGIGYGRTRSRSEFVEHGREAALDGQAIDDNPYPLGSQYRDAWDEGWRDGMRNPVLTLGQPVNGKGGL